MADIENYEQAKAWLAKGRNQRKGRKLRSYMMRMDSSGAIIMSSMYYASDGIAELTPDNILTFTMRSEGMQHRSASLSMTLYNMFGLTWRRVGMKRYDVGRYDRDSYWNNQPAGHEYFRGMRWNISTGKCLNPRPSVLDDVDNDKRKIWIAQLAKFRRAFKVRVRLGLVQSIADSINDGLINNVMPSQYEVETAVLQAIMNGNVSTSLIETLAWHARRRAWGRQYKAIGIEVVLNSIINSNSIRFRQEFGVLRSFDEAL